MADAEKTAPGLPETCSALSPSWGLKLMKVSSPRAKPRRVAPTPSLGSKCQASERAAGRSGQVQGLPQRPRARPPKPRGGGAASGTGAAGSGVPRERPGAKCPRQPCPARRARTRALLTAEAALGGHGGHGGRVGVRGARLCSAPGQLPARGAAEEPRGRSGRPSPRRRLEARPASRDGGWGAPCWEPPLDSREVRAESLLLGPDTPPGVSARAGGDTLRGVLSGSAAHALCGLGQVN